MHNGIDNVNIDKLFKIDEDVYKNILYSGIENGAIPNVLRDLVNDQINSRVLNIANNIAAAQRPRISIRQTLSSVEMARLTAAYPRFDIHFTPVEHNPHGVAAASRRLEYAELLSRIGYDSNNGNYPTDDFACDLGGDWMRHIEHATTGIHSCCPILSAYDDQRQTQRLERLRALGARRGYASDGTRGLCDNVVRNIVAANDGHRSFINANPVCCNSRFGDCDRTALYGLAVHSIYDVSLTEIADGMTNKEMSIMYGTFIWDTSILLQTSGELEDLGVHYRIDKTTNRIKFGFVDDSSFVYEHDLYQYLTYVFTTVFYNSNRTNKFIMELMENRLGVQYFRIVKTYNDDAIPSDMIRRHWFTDVQDKVIVTYPEFEEDKFFEAYGNGGAVNTSAMFTIKTIVASRELVTRGLEQAYSFSDEKFRPQEIYDYLRSYNRRIYFGGKDILSRSKCENPDDLFKLAMVIYVYVFVKKYTTGKATQYLIGNVKYNRDLLTSSLLTKFFKKPPELYDFKPWPFTRFFHEYIYRNRRTNLDTAKMILPHIRFIEINNTDDVTTWVHQNATHGNEHHPGYLHRLNNPVLDAAGHVFRLPKILDLNFDTEKLISKITRQTLALNKDPLITDDMFEIKSMQPVSQEKRQQEGPHQQLQRVCDEICKNVSGKVTRKSKSCGDITAEMIDSIINDFDNYKTVNEQVAESDTPYHSAQTQVDEVIYLTDSSDDDYGNDQGNDYDTDSSDEVNLQDCENIIKAMLGTVESTGRMISFLDIRDYKSRSQQFTFSITDKHGEDYIPPTITDDSLVDGELIMHVCDKQQVKTVLEDALNFIIDTDVECKTVNIKLDIQPENEDVQEILATLYDGNYANNNKIRVYVNTPDNYTGSSAYDFDALKCPRSNDRLIKVDVPGDGKCCLYALNRGETNVVEMMKIMRDYAANHAKELADAGVDLDALELEMAEGSNLWHGLATVTLYGQSHSVNVCIHDVNRREYIVVDTPGAGELIHLYYTGNHYDYLRDDAKFCSKTLEDSEMGLRNYVDSDYQDTTKGLTSMNDIISVSTRSIILDSVTLAMLVKKYFGDDEKVGFCDRPDKLVDFSGTTGYLYYDYDIGKCNDHSQCLNNALVQKIHSVLKSGFKGKLLTGIDTANINAHILGATLHNFEEYKFIRLTEMNNSTQVILCLNLETRGRKNQYPLLASLEKILDHRITCKACKTGQTVPKIWYDSESNCYYNCFCQTTEDGKVRYVGQLPTADRIIKLGMRPTNQPNLKFMAVNNTINIFVNVRVADYIDRNDLNTIIEEYDQRYGDVKTSVVAVEVNSLTGYEPLIYHIAKKSDVVYVKESNPIMDVDVKDMPMDRQLRKNFSKNEKLRLYCPTYNIKSSDPYTKMQNAAMEVSAMWQVAQQLVMDNIYPTHHSIVKKLNNNSFKDDMVMDDTYGMIDLKNHRWIVKPRSISETGYNMVYDGDRIVSFSVKTSGSSDGSVLRGVADTKAEFVSVHKDLRIMNAPSLYATTRYCNINRFNKSIKVNLFSGVPGAGKTRYILTHHDYGVDDSMVGDLVLTTTKEAANDLIRRVKQSTTMGDTKLYNKYRTGDSYLMHSNCKAKTIWVDEGFMKHAGEIAYYALKTECTEINIFGDAAQIPFINRYSEIEMSFSNIAKFGFKVLNMTHTYRCPCDVTVILNRLNVYSFKVTTSSNVRSSIHVENISTVAAVPQEDNVQYLTFTQGEKESLKKHGFGDVNTVHEYQGKQHDRVFLVREKTKPDPVFDSINHIVVAISRHTKELRYYTVVNNDGLSKILNKGISEIEMKEVYKNYIRGGYTVDNDVVPVDYNYDYERILRRKVLDDSKKYGPTISTRIDKKSAFYNKMNYVHPKTAGLVEIMGHSDIKPTMVKIFGESRLKPQPPPYVTTSDLCDVRIIQATLDRCFRYDSTENYEWDVQQLEYSDYSIIADKFRIDTSRWYKSTGRTFAKPVLRTSIASPVNLTFTQVIKAFTERNGAVPDYTGPVGMDTLTETTVERFINTYIADEQVLDMYTTSYVSTNSAAINSWCNSLPKSVRDMMLKSDVDLSNFDLASYTFILKRNSKPVLDGTGAFQIPSPQTIAFHAKLINMIFCPVFRILRDRLIGLLKPNYIINTACSVEELEETLSNVFPPRNLNQYSRTLEVDFSKYDKSQNLRTLNIEMGIYRRLGMHPDLVALWQYAHVYTNLHNIQSRFSANVNYQRKSGDAATFFGNTCVLMAVMSYVYDLRDTVSMFAGDDSFVFSQHQMGQVSDTVKFAQLYGLESKLLHYNVPYFCSKFIVSASDNYFNIVPDPIKLSIKLGRRDVVNREHAEEYRVSTCDNTVNYGNVLLHDAISGAINDRYGLTGHHGAFLTTLYNLPRDASKFEALYDFRNTNDNIHTFAKFDI